MQEAVFGVVGRAGCGGARKKDGEGRKKGVRCNVGKKEAGYARMICMYVQSRSFWGRETIQIVWTQ